LLNMLAADEDPAILMYLGRYPRLASSCHRCAARVKPVIANPACGGRQGCCNHTGALAGADRVVDAAVRRAGVIRGDDLEDLFNAAEITARFRPLSTGRVAIVTNGGGAGVLAVDRLIDEGGSLAALQDQTMSLLDASLPPTWSRANPVDIIGDAPAERYRATIEAVAADPGVDALLVMNCPTGLASPKAQPKALPPSSRWPPQRQAGPRLLVGQFAAESARSVLRQAGVASFDTPCRPPRR
jgi:acetyltransferase